MKIESNVKHGKIEKNREIVIDTIRSLNNKDIVITIEQAKKTRSNNQNEYLWGLVYPVAQKAFYAEWGEHYSIADVHLFFKTQFNFKEKVNLNTGEIVKVPKSTTKNNTHEQEIYHEQIRRFLDEWFGVVCPLPDKNYKISQNS